MRACLHANGENRFGFLQGLAAGKAVTARGVSYRGPKWLFHDICRLAPAGKYFFLDALILQRNP